MTSKRDQSFLAFCAALPPCEWEKDLPPNPTLADMGRAIRNCKYEDDDREVDTPTPRRGKKKSIAPKPKRITPKRKTKSE